MSQRQQETANPYAVFATNDESDFSDFSLTLSNGATLTGIAHIPTSGLYHSSPHKPLVLGIHGGSCSAYTYDASPEYTASTYSTLTGIPFVAFHRPNVCGSSGWLYEPERFPPPAEGSSYFEHEAKWFDSYIFPALWENFGRSNGCSQLVTDSHSMAVIPTTIAAGYYAEKSENEKTYPWAGMIFSGLGEVPTETMLETRANSTMWQYDDVPHGNDPKIHVGPFTRANKLALMLGPPDTCAPELDDLLWKQNVPFITSELMDLNGVWIAQKAEFKAKVKLPVFYALGTMDWLWKHEREHVDIFTRDFANSPRVEGALIENDPHAIEWSPMAGGWWLRVFGWAVEVTTSEDMKSLNLKGYK